MESAIACCASADFFLINFPKIKPITMKTGTVANMNKVSFLEINKSTIIPKIKVKICLKNSAKSIDNVSCNC